MRVKSVCAVLLSLSLLLLPVAPVEAGSAAAPAVLAKMTAKGTVEINGTAMPAEASVFAGDRIATRVNTVAALSLPGGDQAFLPEHSSAQLQQEGAILVLRLDRGGVVLVRHGTQPLRIETIGVRIEPAGSVGVFEVAVKKNALRVQARRGMALVKSADRTVEVKEGTALDATVAPPQGPAGTAAGGLSTLQTAVLVAAVAAGVTGLALGAVAMTRPNPKDCSVTGTVSPFTITCP